MTKAVRTDSTDAALQALREGRLDAARAHAHEATAAVDAPARAWAALGTVHFVAGELAEAKAALIKATELSADFAEAYLNLAAVYTAAGALDDAWTALTTAATLSPVLAIGPALGRLRAAAQAVFDAAPTHEAGARVVALCCASLDYPAAIEVARRLATLDNAEAWALLGDTLLRAGRHAEAKAAAERAHQLAPHDPAHLANAAGTMIAAGDLHEAEALARRAVAAHPTACRPRFLLGSLLADQGREEEARGHFLAAAEAQDADAIAIGRAWYEASNAVDWSAAARVAPRLRGQLDVDHANPFSLTFAPVSAATQHRNAIAFTRHKWPRRRPLAVPAAPKSRLRVGYLSPDFRDHPITHLVKDLFRHHDRARFEVCLYGLGAEDGGIAGSEVRALGDSCVWLEKLSDHDAARRIQADGVDILVDLAGYTKRNGLGVLAFRPAPVQIHYLGFPGTIGAPFIDYIVGDPWTVPVAHEAFYSEKVIRLPHTYQINSARPFPEQVDKRRFGFQPQQMVYCSFNHVRKISAEMFDVWCAILRDVPHGVLWLLIENEYQGARLVEEAGRRGIAPARIHLARRLPRAAHLARLAAADLHLDTLPYNAHTTASDALWAGCPLLTTPGETFAARVSAGILAAAGLDDCIARDLDDYRAFAVRLGHDQAALAALKVRTVAARHSTLFDAAGFTRLFESGLNAAWERAALGLPLASINIAGK